MTAVSRELSRAVANWTHALIGIASVFHVLTAGSCTSQGWHEISGPLLLYIVVAPVLSPRDLFSEWTVHEATFTKNSTQGMRGMWSSIADANCRPQRFRCHVVFLSPP